MKSPAAPGGDVDRIRRVLHVDRLVRVDVSIVARPEPDPLQLLNEMASTPAAVLVTVVPLCEQGGPEKFPKSTPVTVRSPPSAATKSSPR